MEKKGIKKKLPAELTILLIFMLIFLCSTLFIDGFMTYDNITNLLRSTAVNGIIAMGMTFVIIAAGIDLSVGAVAGLAGIVTAMMMSGTENIVLPILGGILAGAAVGALNAVFIFEGKVPPFIATLGTQTAVRGFIMLITGARLITKLPKAFTGFAQVRILGIPAMVLVWIGVVIIGAFIVKFTLVGRNIYAIGSNTEAARLSGINIRKNTYFVYIFAAVVSAVAGIVLTTRLSNGIPTAGQGFEQDAIAAVIIGGASFNGGEGTVLGTVIGALIMQTLKNAGNLLGINSFLLEIMTGLLLVGAVMIDQLKKRGQ